MTTRPRPSTRIGRLLAEQARSASPHEPDLWPSIAAELKARHPEIGRQRRRWMGESLKLAGALAALLVLGLLLARLFETHESQPAATPVATPLATPEVVTDGPGDLSIRVGPAPAYPAYGAGALWVPTQGDGRLLRLDPHSGATLAAIDMDVEVESEGLYAVMYPQMRVAADAERVWVAIGEGVSGAQPRWRLARIDPRRNRVQRTRALDLTVQQLELYDGDLWIVGLADPAAPDAVTLLRLDGDTGEQVASIALSGRAKLAVGAEGVWVLSIPPGTDWAANSDATLARMDRDTNQLETVTVIGGGQNVIVGAGSVWVSNGRTTSVDQLDPVTGIVRADITTSINGDIGVLVLVRGDLWTITRTLGAVRRFDPALQQLVDSYAMLDVTLTATDDAVWMASASSNLLARVDLGQ